MCGACSCGVAIAASADIIHDLRLVSIGYSSCVPYSASYSAFARRWKSTIGSSRRTRN